MRLRPGHSSPHAFVRLASKRTPALLLGRLGKSKGPRLRPNIGMRFEVPLGSIVARALAHRTGQAVAVASPATEARGTPIKGQRSAWVTRCRETT